jgi:predicted RNase H-like nuclease (RuvC/YqgF family)
VWVLFAEETATDNVAVLVAVSSIIAGAFGWVAKQVVDWRATNRAKAKEDRKDTITEWQELAERVERDRKKCEDEYKALQERQERLQARVTQLERENGQANTWISGMEAAMAAANLKYPAWDDFIKRYRAKNPDSDGKKAVTPAPQTPPAPGSSSGGGT